ncbi:MAG TPA: PASTA domain-containing protein [Streptosporangiaceae bacterium]
MGTASGRARRGVPALLAAAGLASVLTFAGTAVPAAAAGPGLYGWGSNIWGTVGNGTLNEAHSPVPDTLPAGAARIAAGGADGAAVLSDGRLAMWGQNAFATIGDGTTATRPSPVVVPGLTGIVQAAPGIDHTLALDSGGTVWSWGSNVYGQLGNGTTNSATGSNPTPVPVPGLTAVVQVANGSQYSLALRSDGTVWAWGENTSGQLGDGTIADQDRAGQVPGLTGITRIAAGGSTSYAVGAGGTLYAWGDNTAGQLGNGTAAGYSAAPVTVPGLTGVTAVVAGPDETLALVGSPGTVWSWGQNRSGTAGDGTIATRPTPAPISLTGVTQIATSPTLSAAVLTSGRLMTWGNNVSGGLGQGSSGNSVHPTPALVPALTGVTQVAVASGNGLAIGSAAPKVPSLIGQTQAEAASTLQAAGFTLGRVAQVVDLTCEFIGEVKSQSPAAGTFAQPGTAVSISIGKPGGKCL